jgi:glycine cleavage system H protein
MNPDDMKFSKSHEWVKVEGEIAIVGISDFAQHELNDIVFVELPEIGKQVAAGKEFGVLESVKTASDLYSPVSGEVIEVNKELENSPDLVNKEPYGNGWIMKLKISNPSEIESLLSHSDYQNLIKG